MQQADRCGERACKDDTKDPEQDEDEEKESYSTHCSRISDDTLHVLLAIHHLGRIHRLLRQVFESGDDEGEGLRVNDMPVEGVELDPGHGIQGALDVGDREVAAGCVEHESAVFLRIR